MDKYFRHSKQVTKTKRWQALRQQAKRRDGWQCVQCGSKHRLEIDHIKPVRTHKALAFDLNNLQTLCASCHTKKIRIEVGFKPLDPKRQEWRNLVRKTSNERK